SSAAGGSQSDGEAEGFAEASPLGSSGGGFQAAGGVEVVGSASAGSVDQELGVGAGDGWLVASGWGQTSGSVGESSPQSCHSDFAGLSSAACSPEPAVAAWSTSSADGFGITSVCGCLPAPSSLSVAGGGEEGGV